LSFQIVLTTTASLKEARTLSSILLDSNLVACVNIIPSIESHYRWEGKLVQNDEFLLLIKSSKAHFERLSSLLLEHHPYEIPEIVALPVESGSKPYLDWLQGQISL
jgi:periplasmic divalent cation tolerance protein